MRSLIFMVAVPVMVFGAGAQAASIGNAGGLIADTPGIENGKPTADHANAQDRLFVRQATLGGRAEVELGKLAQSRSKSPQIRSFGEKMTADHTRANDQLTRIGRSVNSEVPKGLDPSDAAFREELQQAQGTPFDQRYLLKQIGDHQRTLNLLQWELSYGQNQALVEYSTEMMPIVHEHLRLAQAALAELTGSAAPR